MNLFLPEQETLALRERFLAVCDRIDKAASAAGRRAGEVTLVAVSKMHPAENLAALVPAWKRGHPVFGENYAQEALRKQEDVASLLRDAPGAPPRQEWHFIGHVQSRKAKDITGRFSLIHTLDSEKLALALHKAVMAGDLQSQAVLVQINIGREAQKSGVLPENAERLLEALRPLRHIRVEGLMCLPPFSNDAEESRPHFAAMRELRDELARRTGLALPHLSMGMSHDYEVAVGEGATMVRVGTGIFGPRPPRA